MIDLFLSNNRIAVFLEKKNKIQITANTKELFNDKRLRYLQHRSDNYILAEGFCQQQLEN